MSATYNAPTPGVDYDRKKVRLHVGRKADQKQLTRLTNEGWEVESIIQTMGMVPTYVLRRAKADRTGPEGLGSLIMRGIDKLDNADAPTFKERMAQAKVENARLKAERKAKREAKRNRR